MPVTVTHLIPDTPFLPFVVDTFEAAAPGENAFHVYGASKGLERHRLPSHVPVNVIETGASDLVHVGRAFAQSKVAIVHTMSTFSAEAMRAAPSSTLKVWSGWGGDYYGTAFNGMSGLLGPRTSRLVRSTRSWREIALRAHATPWLRRLYRDASVATDIFSAPVPTDFAVFRHRFPKFGGQYHQLNYASVEDTYSVSPDQVTGRNILVGNSANPENNHLETLELLAQVGISDRQVIVPLSYGDLAYGDVIERAGRDLFGAMFIPVREFLPLQEYSRIVASCGVVVMGHRRQQALGNIARASWQGAHVFLDPRSPVVEFFRSVGMPVSTLDELRLHGVPVGERTQGEISYAREVARSLWGREVVLKNIRSLLASA
jgi:dTDP-N-acetylfucosamine:lipid II N-acetylfucosaminyltransferase